MRKGDGGHFQMGVQTRDEGGDRKRRKKGIKRIESDMEIELL